jgi:hypothetical protein
LATAPRLAVTGRQGDQRALELRFGPWRVTNVRRTWVTGSGLEVSSGRVGLDLDRATQRFTFDVAEGSGPTWRADCRSTYRHDGVVLPVGSLAMHEVARLACSLRGSDDSTWVLDTWQSLDRMPAGVLHRGEDTLTVRGLDRFVGAVPSRGVPSRGVLAGWLVLHGAGPVAAVEVVNAGAVWMDVPPNAGYRRALGAVAAALLVHEDLREVIQRTSGG